MRNKTLQKGATLILSVVVLSAVLVISLALSTLSVREQRQAGEVRRSEPALYASEGALEELVYLYARGSDVNTVRDCQTPNTTGSTFADSSTSVQYTRCINFKTRELVFSLAPGETKFFLLSDRANPTRFPTGHRWVGGCLRGVGSLQFSVFSFDNTTVGTASEVPDSSISGSVPTCPSTVAINDVRYANTPLDISKFYYLRLKNLGSSSIAGSILAKDASNVQLDLPSENVLLQSQGINLQLRRRVQVDLPQ